jgi:membrane-associated phospholipid phosphatase
MDPRPLRRDPWPWVGLACAVAWVVLAALVIRRGGLAFDEPFAAWLRGLPIPVELWKAITFLGGVFLLPVGFALGLGALLSGRGRLVVIIAVVLIGAALFTDAVKDLVMRARPPDPLVPAPGYSFPSGHTLNSTATYGLIAVIAWRSRLSLAVRRTAAGVGVVLPFLIGLSRIALGAHWPTDVIAGWLAGTVFVALGATLITFTGAMERDMPWTRKASPGR